MAQASGSQMESSRMSVISEGPQVSEKGVIAIRGAREGCLQGVDLDIPLGRLICFTGPAGGGARTLAVDVLYREGRRRYLQALSAFEREFHAGLQKAEVEEILGLPPAILLPGTPPRRTIADFLRFTELASVLFERLGESTCPACDGSCAGYGVAEAARHAVDSFAGTRALVVAPVALQAGGEPAAVLEEIRRAGFPRILVNGGVRRTEEIDSEALAELGDTLEVVVDRVAIGADALGRIGEALQTARVMSGGRSLLVVEKATIPLNQQLTCTSCGREYPGVSGEGLLQTDDVSDSSRVGSSLAGSALQAVLEMGIDRAISWLGDVRESTAGRRDAISEGALEEATAMLSRLAGFGLHHLPLSRSTGDLASGEWLRLVLALTASRALTGILYVVEPCSGLEETHLGAAIQALRQLAAGGNTVVVQDNDPAVFAASARVFAFRNGEVFSAPDPTVGEAGRKRAVRLVGCSEAGESGASILIRDPGDRGNSNLGPVDIEIPTGRLVVVTGGSGAGATSLLRDIIAPSIRPGGSGGGSRQRRAGAGRGPVEARTASLRRLTDLRDLRGHGDEPVVQTIGLLGPVATLFSRQPTAVALGLKPEWFRLDRPGGRCGICEGTGRLRLPIDFLADVAAPCSGCEGGRYSEDARKITHRGRSPNDILDMTADEARRHFSREGRIAPPLDTLSRFGMGGYRLGRSTGRLEFAERLRLKLAASLWRASEKDLLLLDAPLAGAHPEDASTLVELLAEIVSKKATVIVADRHPELVKNAGWILVLGPGSGADGGRIVAEGTPR